MEYYLGGGSTYSSFFTPKIGEMIQFDEHLFSDGWFNHRLEEAHHMFLQVSIFFKVFGDEHFFCVSRGCCDRHAIMPFEL